MREKCERRTKMENKKDKIEKSRGYTKSSQNYLQKQNLRKSILSQ